MTVLEDAVRRANTPQPAEGQSTLMSPSAEEAWTYPDRHHIGWITNGVARYTAACPSCRLDATWQARHYANGKWRRTDYTITCPTDTCKALDFPSTPLKDHAAA